MDLHEAIVLATELHKDQTDKQGKPYILHPLRVMLAAPAELQVCAILHDIAEDCDHNILTEVGFWERLTGWQRNILDGLTHRKNETREKYIGRVLQYDGAVQIKLLDIHDNLDRVYGLPNDSRERLIAKYSRDLHQIATAGWDIKTGARV